MRRARFKGPVTDAEWQTAVNAAHGALCLDAARKYGLVTGGPEVNVERCEKMLRDGRRRGARPAPDAAEKFARELAQQGPA